MFRKCYVENMDRKHHLGYLGADGKITFYATLYGVNIPEDAIFSHLQENLTFPVRLIYSIYLSI